MSSSVRFVVVAQAALWWFGPLVAMGQCVTPVTIVDSPDSVARCAGSFVTLRVVATGDPTPTFQWRLNGQEIPGATATTYRIASMTADRVGDYDCVVTNACGSVLSDVATLTYATAAVVTAEPADTTGCVGRPVVMSVEATSPVAVTYQWRRALPHSPDTFFNIEDSNEFSGVNTPTLTINANFETPQRSGTRFLCRITNTCGTVSTRAATLTMRGPRWEPNAIDVSGFTRDATVADIAVLSDGDLVVVGEFARIGELGVGNVARWDKQTRQWSGYGGGMNGGVNAVVVLPNGDVVAGGIFTVAGGVGVNRVAKWIAAEERWVAMGSGFDRDVHDLLRMPNGDIIAAGLFGRADGIPSQGFARWDGTSWSPMAMSVGIGQALALRPDGSLVAGVSSVPDYLHVWNGSGWSTLAGGTSGPVHALAVAPNGSLFVGGQFATVNSGRVLSRGIAQLSAGGAWSGYESGVDFGTVEAIAVTPRGDMVIGGTFTRAGGLFMNNIARFSIADGVRWLPLESGVSDTVLALAALPNGDIVVGGSFDVAGGRSTPALAVYISDTAEIEAQPAPIRTCVGANAEFVVVASGTGTYQYAWRKNGIAIDPIRNPSAETATLRLSDVTLLDQGSYDCLVLTPGGCQRVQSGPAMLTVCLSDRTCDGIVDFHDYMAFVTCFETEACEPETSADFNDDGFVDFFDYADFVAIFESGC